MRDPVETDEPETETDATMDATVAARIRQYAYVESGRRGGSKTGPTKARKGTGENVSRYWARVYAGEIQHPGYDPNNPKTKKRVRRSKAATQAGAAMQDARNVLTVSPSPGIGGLSADVVLEDDFAASLGRMGF